MGADDRHAKLDAGKPPVYRGFMAYFPRAIREVAKVSQYGLEKYKAKWGDKTFLTLDKDRLLDALGRHMVDRVIEGEVNYPDGELLHRAQIAWEAMAQLEIYLLERENSEVRPYPVSRGLMR